MSALRIYAVALTAMLLSGCTSPPSDTATKSATQISCTEPRPAICHKALHRVCATRDNGVRCVTTPCDSTEQLTYANECLACADKAVYGYREGACET